MSFSSDLKNEIIKQGYKNACCRRAFLSGILSAKARIEGELIALNLENDEFSLYVSKFIKEFYGRDAEISAPPKGGRCRRISFVSKSCAAYIASLHGGAEFFNPKCQGCESAFLRGFFFSAGRISDPEKQYMLEFSPVSHAERFIDLLSDVGISAKLTLRRGSEVIYVKNSVMIEDFLAISGMNSATFALINAKIEGELRNAANRIANCETNNIGKAVTASHKKISIIEALERANLLSSLPEELERTARLRLLHRDLSLSQLAAISVPAISKSGLSHRLNKIIEYAGQLLPENLK